MLAVSLPDTLATLLAAFAPCFTVPTLRTFQALVAGFLAQPGQRTVTGMLVGARLAGRRHHDLAYRFFATARWSADQLGLCLLDLIIHTLIPADAPVVLATDDTLWHRSGPKLHGAAWHHDGNGPGRHRPAWGHRWVVVGVICPTTPPSSWPASWSTRSPATSATGRSTWSATPPTSANRSKGCPPTSP